MKFVIIQYIVFNRALEAIKIHVILHSKAEMMLHQRRKFIFASVRKLYCDMKWVLIVHVHSYQLLCWLILWFLFIPTSTFCIWVFISLKKSEWKFKKI